jgi:hypothetical protein
MVNSYDNVDAESSKTRLAEISKTMEDNFGGVLVVGANKVVLQKLQTKFVVARTRI